MERVAFLLGIKPGNEAEVESFFQHGKLVVEGQPATTLWFAFRLGLTTYGAFAVFADPVGNEFGLYEEPRP